MTANVSVSGASWERTEKAGVTESHTSPQRNQKIEIRCCRMVLNHADFDHRDQRAFDVGMQHIIQKLQRVRFQMQAAARERVVGIIDVGRRIKQTEQPKHAFERLLGIGGDRGFFVLLGTAAIGFDFSFQNAFNFLLGKIQIAQVRATTIEFAYGFGPHFFIIEHVQQFVDGRSLIDARRLPIRPHIAQG